jgi:hypothetical protein
VSRYYIEIDEVQVKARSIDGEDRKLGGSQSAIGSRSAIVNV